MVTVLALLGVLAVLFVAAVLSTREGPVLADAPADAADVPLPDGPLQPEDVGRLRFSLAARGYRMSEVDLALERLAAELADRDRRIALLEAAAEGHEPPVGAAVAREATADDLPLPEAEPAGTGSPGAVAPAGGPAVAAGAAGGLVPAGGPAVAAGAAAAAPPAASPTPAEPGAGPDMAAAAAPDADAGPAAGAPVAPSPAVAGADERVTPPADATPPAAATVAHVDSVPPLPPVTVHAEQPVPLSVDAPVTPSDPSAPVDQPEEAENGARDPLAPVTRDDVLEPARPRDHADEPSGSSAATADVAPDTLLAALEETGEQPPPR